MDSSNSNSELLTVFNVQNAKDFKRDVKLSEESNDRELIGFKEGKMIFKDKIQIKEPGKLSKRVISKDAILNHSKSDLKNLNIYKKTGVVDVPKVFQIEGIKRGHNPDKKDITPKLMFDSHGKKFIYLNGQKLQIIKHSPKVEDKPTNKVPTPISKPADLKALFLNSPGTNVSTSPMCKDPQPNYNVTGKHLRSILPKNNSKVVQMKKNESSTNLTLVMKEVGGTITLLSPKVSTQGIPLIKEIVPKSNAPDKQPTIKVCSLAQMAPSQCECKKNQNSVSVSTNTEQLNSVHVGVQTEVISNDQDSKERIGSSLGELYSGGVIIGDDVNMGHGPPSIYSLNEEKMKLKFFNDLHRCLKWDSGNLPIHRGVVQEDLQEVKSQCVVLKARKAGVNIANSNNFTPLQLAVVNNVSIEIVEVLLKYDADMSVLDSEGNNVLHLAVEHNRNDLVKVFLEKLDTSKLDIDQFNYDGLTPLMMCAFQDRIDMAEQFLQKNAQLNLKDLKSGRTAIFHAAESHNASMVLLLLDYCADTKIRNFFGTSVHDAMFELDDIPKEIKYPILGRDLKVHEKRKLHQQKVRKECFKRKKLEIVSTIQKLESRANFVSQDSDIKK